MEKNPSVPDGDITPAPARSSRTAVRAQVLAAERESIITARRQGNKERPDARNPVALALSGGGIRSATFCLGVLQAIEKHGGLRLFDYVSTVSGGGFIGSWWSALMSRPSDPRPADPVAPPKYAHSVFPPARTERRPDREHPLLEHLRMHSNYLIPRHGAFSWDTWRAITVIGRNLVLTWLVLLPFLFAAVIGAQTLFLVLDPQLITGADGTLDEIVRLLGVWSASAGPLVIGALVALGLVTVPWLWIQGAKPSVPNIGGVATMILLAALVPRGGSSNRWTIVSIALWLVVAAALFVRRYLADRARLATKSSDRAVLRNQIAEVQQHLVMYGSLVTLLLVAGGLGHFVLPLARIGVGSAVAVAGGWIALLGSVLSAGYAAFKMSPSAGADTHTTNRSLSTRILFAIAPPLLLVTLLIALAGAGRSAITAVLSDGAVFNAVVFINLLGVLIAWVYATCEASWIQVFRRFPAMAVLVGMCGAAAGTMAGLVWPLLGTDLRRWVLLIFATFSFWMMAARFSALITTDDERTTLRENGKSIPAWPMASVLFSVIFIVSASMTLGAAGVSRDVSQVMGPLMSLALIFSLALGAITYSRLGEGQRRKALWLLAFSSIVSACWTVAALRGWPPASPALAGIALLAVLSTWVLAVGWSTDPNALSLHTFYRARLVRGYLGASNPKRLDRGVLIDDAVEGDDMKLQDLENSSRGMPYHLVNATLNLVGDSKVGAVQRMAAPFLFSKLFCGSHRCNFTPTRDYVGGELTLGTAVAVSGAAASPNVGSQTLGAAMAMLMTLFNVRLGFWAPTPGAGAERSRQARFWAFYTLNEFLSRTTDKASYCFLSDGGHFDNTAVHALVERGCRHIVAVDCGADPLRTFADVGELVRLCRIDFGAEIDLRIDGLRIERTSPERLSKTAFVVGTIHYNDQHLLDIDDPTPSDTVGYIVLIKPSLVLNNPLDVRQYAYGHDTFPQQSTVDQFFDEPQFESYRRLGFHCGEAAFDALMPAAERGLGNAASPVPGHPLGAVFARFTNAIRQTADEGVQPVLGT
ncbi:MAG TPA: patatin-like phospholipase family protein [Vicinamibacterales bacterium]|nr:patatin-like phospholipase family protein [Vicinamibacterales bacterium]